jgi:ethanolamine utilization microcompartment shell protein EutS
LPEKIGANRARKIVIMTLTPGANSTIASYKATNVKKLQRQELPM